MDSTEHPEKKYQIWVEIEDVSTSGPPKTVIMRIVLHPRDPYKAIEEQKI